MKPKKILRDSFTVLKETVKGFSEDKGLKLSASLAYYTLFSLAPLLLLVISLAGAFFGEDAVKGTVFTELNGLLGNQAAAQVQEIIKNMELSGDTTFSLVVSAVTLIIGATTVFGELQDSINMIWSVKAKPKRGWVKLLKDRLLSGSLIIGLGFLLLVSLVVNGLLDTFNSLLKAWFAEISVILFYILSVVVNLIVLSVVFAVIYKVLPDAKIKWRDVRAGAVFTTLLFLLGRYVIGLYISSSGTASTYGAAGSLIVILLWVYYSAVIMYFSAEFTKAYAAFKGEKILPAEYAVYVEEKETEQDNVNVAKESTDKS